jgi:peptidyl-prolyl cis-trans isomerase D
MKPMRCFCVFAASAFFAATCAAQPDGLLDGILVVVNNSVITFLQVQDQYISQLPTLRTLYPDPAIFNAKANQMEKDALEMLEQNKLILDDFARGAYSTNWLEDEVAAAVKRDLKKSYSGSRTRLIQTLQAGGVTYADYLKQQRENVIISALIDLHTTSKVIISPAAIEKWYNDHQDDYKVEDQVKLRMIQIPQPAGSPPGAAKQIAGEILQKIDNGVPFAEMATVYDSGPERAAGGDCGWVARKGYLKELTDAAFALKPGQHAPVVELPDERAGAAPGATVCYLLMVDDFRPAHISPLSDVQADIERKLRDQRGKLLEDQWIERLKAKSHIRSF